MRQNDIDFSPQFDTINPMARKFLNIGKTVRLTPYLDWDDIPKIKNEDGDVIPKYTELLLNIEYEIKTPDNKIITRIRDLSQGKIELTGPRWKKLVEYVCNEIIVSWADSDRELLAEMGVEPVGEWGGEEKETHIALLIEEEELVNRFFEKYNELYSYQEKKIDTDFEDS